MHAATMMLGSMPVILREPKMAVIHWPAIKPPAKLRNVKKGISTWGLIIAISIEEIDGNICGTFEGKGNDGKQKGDQRQQRI